MKWPDRWYSVRRDSLSFRRNLRSGALACGFLVMALALGACGSSSSSSNNAGDMVDFAAAETLPPVIVQEETVDESAAGAESVTETETETEMYGMVFRLTEETWYGVKNVNIRTEPNTDCEVAGVLSAGDELPVTGISDEWLMVTYDGQTCFVSVGYMARVEDAADDEVAAEQFLAD